MDERVVAEYLRRLDVTRPQMVDAGTLCLLHRAHQIAVPFENLSIHLGEPISLDEDDLIGKIVSMRRGGFCYEIRTSGGSRVEQQLSDDAALLTAYGDYFGIILDRVPAAAPRG